MSVASQSRVLIAGAGPVGLTLAIALRLQGIGCRIVDPAPTACPPDESRALAIAPRTMELLDRLGLAVPIAAAAQRVVGIAIHAGAAPIAELSLDGLESRFPFLLALEQGKTERIMIERLAALGGEVERGLRLDRFSQDDRGVEVELAYDDGRVERIGVDWLIGCDGAHSAVRHGLGLAFDGAAYEDDLRLIDARLEGPQPQDRAWLFLNRGEPPLGLIPMRDGWFRIISILPTGSTAPDRDIPLEQFFAARLSRFAKPGMRLGAVRWQSRFRIHRRMVGRYRVGRVFLAGDAAHIHSPAGGQGMNTGIQDAINLGWKLAALLQGRATQGLLDSYDRERRPVAAGILRNTDRAMRQLRLNGGFAHLARRLVLPVLVSMPGLRHRFAMGVSQLAVDYGTGGWRGRRLPDPALADGRRLYETLGGFGQHLLLTPPGTDLAAIAAQVAQNPNLARLRPEIMSGGGQGGLPPFLLVRPDLYIEDAGEDLGALTTVL